MLRTTKAALLAVAVMATAATTAAAQDQEAGDVRVDLPPRKTERRQEDEPHLPTRSKVGTPGPLRVYGGFSLAVAGDRHETTGDFETSPHLDPTLGFQGGADYVLHKYFSIGGEMRFLWAKLDGLADRDFLWDLDVKPRGRYAFDKLPLEVYGALPIGLTVAGISGAAEGKAGFNVGLVGGATWWFTSHMGVNAEMGWVFHKYGRDVEVVNTQIHSDLSMNQFLLLCPNFVYAL
jgi:hypothetical protein